MPAIVQPIRIHLGELSRAGIRLEGGVDLNTTSRRETVPCNILILGAS